MRAKIMKSLLTIACLLGSISVSAYDFTVDGIYYDIVSMSDLTCGVTSGGKYSGDVVIPEKVTYNNRTLTVVKIFSKAFANKGVTSVTIPNSVTEIGHYAFDYCRDLEKVIIEDGTETLKFGSYIFDKSPLESLYLGRNIFYNNDSPFESKSSLIEVIISDFVTSIGESAFSYCSGLTNVTIPNSVTSIDYKAFYGCSNLEKIIIEDGTETLGCGISIFNECPLESLYLGRNLSYDNISYPPFLNKSSLKEVIISDSVTSIGYNAFYRCFGLTNMTIPNSVTKIGGSAFSGCSGLTNVTIPNSVTEIGSYAFSNCSGLTSVTIPNSMTKIDDGTFSGCSGLTSMTIPNSVIEIGKDAFSDCSGLTSMTIPNSVTKIGNAFSGCSGLTSLYSLNPIPPTIGGGFTNAQYMDLNVYVPQGSLSAYQSTNVWKNFWNLQEYVDPSGIETVKTDGKNIDGVYYDIQGRKLDAPKNGLNIINGKKVVIKK